MVTPASSSKGDGWLGHCRNGDVENNGIGFCKPETTQIPDPKKSRRKQTLNFCKQQNKQKKYFNFLLSILGL